MTQEYTPIRHILVALDASESSLSALEAAVELAARFKAELIGLFVEDINMLRLAQLPFAREVSAFSAMPRRLKSMDLELLLRAQAERVHRIMARMAGKHDITWRFRIARGTVSAELLAAGAEADLLVLGKIGRSLPGFQRTGSTVRMMVLQRPGLTMILQAGVRWTLPVTVLYNGTGASRKALSTAAYLVRSQESKLNVIVIAKSKDEARDRQMAVIDRLQSFGIGADFRLLVRPAMAGLAQRILQEGLGTVIIPCHQDWFEGEQLCALVEEITNPVLLVR